MIFHKLLDAPVVPVGLILGADLKNGLLEIDLARPEPERMVKTVCITDHD